MPESKEQISEQSSPIILNDGSIYHELYECGNSFLQLTKDGFRVGMSEASPDEIYKQRMARLTDIAISAGELAFGVIPESVRNQISHNRGLAQKNRPALAGRKSNILEKAARRNFWKGVEIEEVFVTRELEEEWVFSSMLHFQGRSFVTADIAKAVFGPEVGKRYMGDLQSRVYYYLKQDQNIKERLNAAGQILIRDPNATTRKIMYTVVPQNAEYFIFDELTRPTDEELRELAISLRTLQSAYQRTVIIPRQAEAEWTRRENELKSTNLSTDDRIPYDHELESMEREVEKRDSEESENWREQRSRLAELNRASEKEASEIIPIFLRATEGLDSAEQADIQQQPAKAVPPASNPELDEDSQSDQETAESDQAKFKTAREKLAGLSENERNVAIMIAAGFRVPEIEARLSLSRGTVLTYSSTVRKTLGVRRNNEIADAIGPVSYDELPPHEKSDEPDSLSLERRFGKKFMWEESYDKKVIEIIANLKNAGATLGMAYSVKDKATLNKMVSEGLIDESEAKSGLLPLNKLIQALLLKTSEGKRIKSSFEGKTIALRTIDELIEAQEWK